MPTRTLTELTETDGLGEAFLSVARRDFLITGLAAGAMAAMPATVRSQTVPASKAAAAGAVAAAEDAILRITKEVWDLAEISLFEVESHKIHLRELEAAGFTTVSTGTSGVPTAFLSE